jgi:hypothetical protein
VIDAEIADQRVYGEQGRLTAGGKVKLGGKVQLEGAMIRDEYHL